MSGTGSAGDRPLVVLQLVANRWWTGSADPVIQLSRGLRARGHRVLLGVIPGGPFADKARAAGFAPEPGFALEARFDPRGWIGDVARLQVRSVRRTDTWRRHREIVSSVFLSVVALFALVARGGLPKGANSVRRYFVRFCRAVSGKWHAEATVSGRDTEPVKRACSRTAAQVTDLRGSQTTMRKARFSTPALGCRSMPLSASF